MIRRQLLSLFVICLIPAITIAQPSEGIEVNGKELFLSGGNVAWVQFAGDIGPGKTHLDFFEQIFAEMSEHGGNTMRLWLHTNGSVTPAWNGMNVSGPGEGTISDLRVILDAAEKQDVSLILCLWSFDMLQEQLSDEQIRRNRGLLTDEIRLQTYIDHALIPMVDALKDHPAIAAWEIFNEPEGMTTEFGWTPEEDRVSMSDVQWFINRTAGAIHRTAPGIPVTNGSWNIRASSDMASFHNYYRDDRLIEAGGDQQDTLDFYSIHYYKHFPTSQSPFHHKATHWKLNKPILVAEFYLSDPRQDGDPDNIYGVHWTDLFTTLYDYGYAGALGWQWFDWHANRTDIDGVDGTLSWPRMLQNMETLSREHPQAVEFSYE